ncbi:MAG: hypothetical protein ABR592_05605 [Nitriliruptorales bacterium]
MTRMKLIFFASADPAVDPKPTWSAYHFAEVASRAGLEAEVRLAGDAVRVALPDVIAATPQGDELRGKVVRPAARPFVVSL